MYVTGTSCHDWATLKYNSEGAEEWVASYGAQSPTALAVDGSGNVYVTGDYFTVKYNTEGLEQWVASYQAPYCCGGSADLALDDLGYVYVTGGAYWAIESRTDYATVKYVQEAVPPVSITKQAPAVVPATVGTSIDYTITVENNSSDAAIDVEVTDFLPRALRFVTGSWVKTDPPDSGTCSDAEDLAVCWVGDIAPDGVVTISLATELIYIPLDGVLSNMACWFSYDPYDDGCAVAATGVGELLVSADLGLGLPAGPLIIDRIISADVDYDVPVTNAGPGAVAAAVVRVDVGSGVQPGSSTWENPTGGSGNCTTSGRIVTCSVGTIPEGGSALIHLETSLIDTAAARLKMSACVAPADTNPQNNCRQWKTLFSSSNRKVIFIQGINSGSACGGGEDGFAPRVEWLERYLTGEDSAGRWVRSHVQLFPRNWPSLLGDFRYFSYANDYSCPGEMAKYGPQDTCNGIPDAAGRLDDLIQDLIAEDPNVSFDFIAHSMGGSVAANWVVNHPNTAKQRVNSVVTFDSPLKGVPSQNAFVLGTVLWGINWGNACNATDTSVAQLFSPWWPQTALVRLWQKAGGIVPFYTIDATKSELSWLPVLKAEVVPGWPQDRTSMAGQRKHVRANTGHSGVWEGKVDVKRFVACAVTQASFCTPVEEELPDLQTGEERRVEATVSPEDVTLAAAALWGEGTVEATLEAPDGSVIDAATQDPNVRHSAEPGYETYEVDHPQPGTWSIVISGIDMPDGGGDVSVRADMLGIPPPDEDEDGVPDGEDNCQAENNPDQSDVDDDGLGDACDPDADNDTLVNESDNCPYEPNLDQEDLDGDGLGEPCDGDNDNDNMADADEEPHACLSTSENDAGDDEDSDTLVNLSEVWLGTDPCDPDTDDDTFDDGVELYVGTDPLDNCPDVVAPESGAQCGNSLDDDGDTRVDDGCPPVGPYESGTECENAVDDDGDTVVNDGCPAFDGDDAWPPDIYIDRNVDIIDVLMYKDRLGPCESEPGFDPRYDLDMLPSPGCSPEELRVDVLDVLLYKPVLGMSCTNP